MSETVDQNSADNADLRLAYLRPDLREAGNIAEVTESRMIGIGTDMSYS
jgi:hypothetical protein